VRTAADTFRPNPDFGCAKAITELGTSEALDATLEAKGVPSVVQRNLTRPPSPRRGPIRPQQRSRIIGEGPVAGQHDGAGDGEPAFEMLQKRAMADQEAVQPEPDDRGSRWTLPDFGGRREPVSTGRRDPAPRRSQRQSVTEAAIKSVVRSVGSALGREIVRGILGGFSRRR